MKHIFPALMRLHGAAGPRLSKHYGPEEDGFYAAVHEALGPNGAVSQEVLRLQIRLGQEVFRVEVLEEELLLRELESLKSSFQHRQLQRELDDTHLKLQFADTALAQLAKAP